MLPRCRWVHTVGMRFTLDVAYLDAEGVVLKTARMSRHRVGVPVWHAPHGGRGGGRSVRALGPARRRQGRDARDARTAARHRPSTTAPAGARRAPRSATSATCRRVRSRRCAARRADLLRGHPSHRGASSPTRGSAVSAWPSTTSTPRRRGCVEVLDLLAAGASVAVVTDAGTPGISDPGSRLVRAAIDAGFRVCAVPGPAALVMALVISGFDTTRFVFEGFLPRSGRDRTARIAAIGDELRTCVLYEAPHRIVRTIDDLDDGLRPGPAGRAGAGADQAPRGGRGGARSPERPPTSPSVAPRGEYVVVVEGSPPATTATDDDLRDALLAAIAGGARSERRRGYGDGRPPSPEAAGLRHRPDPPPRRAHAGCPPMTPDHSGLLNEFTEYIPTGTECGVLRPRPHADQRIVRVRVRHRGLACRARARRVSSSATPSVRSRSGSRGAERRHVDGRPRPDPRRRPRRAPRRPGRAQRRHRPQAARTGPSRGPAAGRPAPPRRPGHLHRLRLAGRARRAAGATRWA